MDMTSLRARRLDVLRETGYRTAHRDKNSPLFRYAQPYLDIIHLVRKEVQRGLKAWYIKQVVAASSYRTERQAEVGFF